MSLLQGECSGEVNFSVARCWALLADVERAPEWQRTLDSVTVIERDDQGRVSVCETVTDARVLKVKVRVRVAYEPPHELRFSQVSSEGLDAMQITWQLEPLGSERTRATYKLALDPGPIGFFARPLERAIRPVVIGHQVQELARALGAG